MARLGDLIEQIRGVSYKPEDLCDSLNEDGIPLLRASNIQDGKLNFEDIIYIDKKKVRKLLKEVFDFTDNSEDEDVLMSSFLASCENKYDKLTGIKMNYGNDHSKYPGYQKINGFCILLQDLKKIKSTKNFYKTVIDKSEYLRDFADDVDEEDWKFNDEDSEFKIKVSAGKTELFTGTVYPTIDFSGSYMSSYRPATMYNRYGDPGDPAEGSETVTVRFDGVEPDFYMENESGEEITTKDFANKLPEGMLRDLYEKYADKIIIDTISGIIEKAGDYEGDW